MTNKKIIFSLLLVSLIIIMLFITKILRSPIKDKIDIIPEKENQIKNYSDCIKAGYPVLELNPPQCGVPDGRMFIER